MLRILRQLRVTQNRRSDPQSHSDDHHWSAEVPSGSGTRMGISANIPAVSRNPPAVNRDRPAVSGNTAVAYRNPLAVSGYAPAVYLSRSAVSGNRLAVYRDARRISGNRLAVYRNRACRNDIPPEGFRKPRRCLPQTAAAFLFTAGSELINRPQIIDKPPAGFQKSRLSKDKPPGCIR